jgi:acetyltransferase-like isoleucine patch superfamily enzyme
MKAILRRLRNRLLGLPVESGEALVRRLGVQFGKGCKFVSVHQRTFGSEPYLVRLGDHVELAGNVRILTHDGGVWVFREQHPEADVFGPVRVGNNVFIGYGCTILPGTVIGDNVVVGAGSVVRGELEGNAVYAGVPARKIRRLDEYYDRISPRFVPTKALNKEEKRRYLENRFNDRAD